MLNLHLEHFLFVFLGFTRIIDTLYSRHFASRDCKSFLYASLDILFAKLVGFRGRSITCMVANSVVSVLVV